MTTGELAQKLSEFPPDVELAFEEVWRPHHGLALANITLGHGEKLVLFFKPKSIINQPTTKEKPNGHQCHDRVPQDQS